MSVVPAIITALLANSGVTTLVGNRIDASFGAQGSRGPSLIVYAASEVDVPQLNGAMDFPAARVTVECRANRASVADQVGDAVIAALKNLNGDFDGKTVQVVGWAHIASDTSQYDENNTLYRRIIDFKCRYRTAPPGP
jgi:hypothetical protein